MRVNISYSMELDDIPRKVMSLVEEAHDQVGEIESLLSTSIERMGKNNHLAALESIKEFREAMGAIDYRLEDCIHILSGYSKAMADLAANGGQPSVPSEAQEMAEAIIPSPLSAERGEWVKEEIRKIQEKKNESKSSEEESG